MAKLDQNFTKFQKDSFQLKFTITDATTSLSNFQAWWGCYPTIPDDWNGSQQNTPVVQKATLGWTTGAAGSVGSEITVGPSWVVVRLTQGDFIGNGVTTGLSEGTYYHELIMGQNINGSDSVVVASGEMTISPSLFTNNLFRW